MKWGLGEILEDENHVELFEAELDTLQGRDLDVCQSDDEERWVRKLDQAVGCRLQSRGHSEWYAFKRQLAERNVRLERVSSLEALDEHEQMKQYRTYRSSSGLRNLLREELEFLVQHLASLPLLLLELELILVAIPILALPVASLVELHIRSLTVELHVLKSVIRAEWNTCASR